MKTTGLNFIEAVKAAKLGKKIRQHHGMRGTRLYRIWLTMKNRCYNHRSKDYAYYGGRGIELCCEWNNDFVSFAKWAIESGYTDVLSIDREDNNRNYDPDNCRWVTMNQQMVNTRRNTDFPGVGFDKSKNRYVARLNKGGKCVFQKWFKHKEDAIEARLKAEEAFGVTVKRRTLNDIVPEPPKTMTFMEAMAKLQEGKKVCRLGIPSDVYFPCWSMNEQGNSALFSQYDILATDWVVVED